MTDELETLADCLGDDHDLVMLEDTVKEIAGEIPPGEMEVFQGLAQQRHEELRASALVLGTRFYAEKPRVFRDRLSGYWRSWRSEKKHPASKIRHATTEVDCKSLGEMSNLPPESGFSGRFQAESLRELPWHDSR